MAKFWKRIEHFTWANFAFTIAGGGTSSMIQNIPYRFKGLSTLGTIVFLFNFSMFWLFFGCIIARFTRDPRLLRRSLCHKVEGQFFACFLLSIATILMDTELYARYHTGKWRVIVLKILYWIYVGVSCFQGIVQYAYLYLTHRMSFKSLGPGILLIIFPSMLSGCIASVLLPSQPRSDALPMIIGGSTLQLMGFNVSMMIYAILLCKFLVHGLPEPSTRPALFIMVGPLAFTGLSLIGLGKGAETVFVDHYISEKADSGGVFAMIGVYQGLICWATCLWMFFVALITSLHGAIYSKMHFKLAWCAMVFPTAGMTMLTIKLGEALGCSALCWTGTVLAVIVCAAYIICTVAYFTAIYNERIMGTGLDEDAATDSLFQGSGSDCQVDPPVVGTKELKLC